MSTPRKLNPADQIQEIFQNLAYNQTQPQDYSAILNWLSTQGNSLGSIVSGSSFLPKSVEGVSVVQSIAFDLFGEGGPSIVFELLDGKGLEAGLKSVPSSRSPSSASPPEGYENFDEAVTLSRLQKVFLSQVNLIGQAESIGQGVPLSQVQNFDQRIWTEFLENVTANRGQARGRHSMKDEYNEVLIQVDEFFSTFTFLSKIVYLIRAHHGQVEGPNKNKSLEISYRIILSVQSPEFIGRLLPALFLVDVLNTKKILDSPIDILLMDSSSTSSVSALEQYLNSHLVYLLLGPNETLLHPTLDHDLTYLPLEQVIIPSSSTLSSLRTKRYVIHSSADLETSLDSITTDVWGSGVTVSGMRGRSFLFVHESNYEKSIKGLSCRISGLKVVGWMKGGDLKAVNFIRRDDLAKAGLGERARKEGVKTFPADSDFSTPTIVYETGTTFETMRMSIAEDVDVSSVSSKRLGHVLVIVSYRTTTELFSLTHPGEPDGIDNILFVSDLSLAKEISSKLKGETVIMNSCQVPINTTNQPVPSLGLLTPRSEIESVPSPGKAPSPFFKEIQKALDAASKVLKITQSQSPSDRLKGLSPCPWLFRDLILNPHQNHDLWIWTLTQSQPYGIVTLIFFYNPLVDGSDENEFYENIMNPHILAHQLKGNSVIVLRIIGPTKVHQTTPSTPTALKSRINESPSGGFQYIEVLSISSSTFTQILLDLSSAGTMSLLLIFHNGNVNIIQNGDEGLTLTDLKIQTDSFSQVKIQPWRSFKTTVKALQNESLKGIDQGERDGLSQLGESYERIKRIYL